MLTRNDSRHLPPPTRGALRRTEADRAHRWKRRVMTRLGQGPASVYTLCERTRRCCLACLRQHSGSGARGRCIVYRADHCACWTVTWGDLLVSCERVCDGKRVPREECVESSFVRWSGVCRSLGGGGCVDGVCRPVVAGGRCRESVSDGRPVSVSLDPVRRARRDAASDEAEGSVGARLSRAAHMYVEQNV